MSCVSPPVQCSRHPVMVTLNFLGRLVNSLLPRKMRWNSRAIGAVSMSSPGVRPVAGQPMMPRILSIPVWRLDSPATSRRRMISGTRSTVTQRSWSCCRVVTSAMVRPDSRVSWASRRTCEALTTPFGMRMRIMACPGVGRRMKTPTHLRRSLSSSPMVFHPSRAKRTRSSWISRPSFSDLSASILFIGGHRRAGGGARRRP